MDSSRLYRSLFLIDDTRNYTNDFYIFEFVKIVLFQEGCFAMSLDDICTKVEELTSLEYTKEDVVHAISIWNNGDIEAEQGLYSLSSAGTEKISKRERRNDIKAYIAQFLGEHSDRYSINKEQLEELLERFIYQRFNENLKEISDILNHCLSVDACDKDYDDEEKALINDFLLWDNVEKNKCVFRLIAKAYDYCMINSKCQSQAIDFSKICFYLDSNVIFRLMGINGSEREFSIKSLIDKCKALGVNLSVSNYVKEECEYTINSQIEFLIESTTRMNSLIPPATMSFAEEKSIRMDFYRRYYAWVKEGNKHRNYDAFKKSILKEFKELLEAFNVDENNPSFKVVEGSNFIPYYDSLYEIKKDKHTTETDVNSFLLILGKRKQTADEEYFLISTDLKLISWLREVFPAQKSIADFPSAWLSIMLKYTGREKDSDYKAFCQFIHLSIEPKIEDLENKIAIKSSIIGSDIDDNIKAMMIDEVKENYHQYKEYEPEKVVHVAYSKAKETIEAEVAQRKDAEHNAKLAELEKRLEKRFDDQKKVFDEQLIEQSKKAKEQGAAAAVEAYKQGQADYAKELKEKEINAKAERIVKRNGGIKKSSIIIAWILLGAVAIAFVMMWTLGAFAEDSTFVKTYQQYDMQIAIGGVILDGLAWVWTATITVFGWFSTDKEAILKKLKEQNA